MKCWKSCAENKENPCFRLFRSMDFLWFFTESWGKSSLGARLRTRKVRGRDATLPAPLLTASLGLVGLGTVGALPQTPQGTLSLAPARGRRKGTKSPLDPFSRLGWSHFHAPSACSFWGLRLSPCLLSQLSVKNQTKSRPERRRMSNSQRMPLGKSTSCAESSLRLTHHVVKRPFAAERHPLHRLAHHPESRLLVAANGARVPRPHFQIHRLARIQPLG